MVRERENEKRKRRYKTYRGYKKYKQMRLMRSRIYGNEVKGKREKRDYRKEGK